MAEGEYGWISPDHASGRDRFQHVAKFVEKPSADQAVALFRSGAVWNTMVLVASASALFELYWTHLPSLARVFARALRLPAPARETFLAEAYQTLAPADFSHQVIAPAQGLSLFTWPAAMGWSDLGTPARLERWMETEALARPEPARTRVHVVESPTRHVSLHVT
jgi:mannose-1-phosphate guanylyltransferase